MRSKHLLAWNGYHLELGEKTCVMGILNVTPDSFSDGGHFYSIESAVAQGKKLAEEGAGILDIGGESTRPFSDPVTVEEETRRVVPVIEELASRVHIPISIDTTKAVVAKRALDAGASIINDIGALRLDPDLTGVAAKAGVPVILMHMLGTPGTMQIDPVYEDLFAEIGAFLEDAVSRAIAGGIQRNRIIVDPGIGFGKTLEHNLKLIGGLDRFSPLGVPILAGPSRKAFIRRILNDGPDKDISPELPIVETGTQAAVAASILHGAHIVRVHDVANTVATVKIIDAFERNKPNK